MTYRGIGWLVGLVTASVVVASCAARVVPATTPGTTATPTTTTGRAPTSRATINRERTELETRRLAALAPLPPGRHPLDHAPAALSGPATGVPVSTSVIDTAHWWTVSMPYEQAVDWIGAHPPVGPTEFGSSASDAGSETRGYSYSVPDSQFWTFAQVEVSVAPAGPHSSYLRIDGLAEWLDPRPARDTGSGHRIHVSAATGCPNSDRGIVGVTNSGPGLDRALLPPGRPTSALVCPYVGLNGRQFTLLRPHTLSGAQAARLATAGRAVSLAHVDGQVIACPSGTGAAALIAFAYPGRTVDLWYVDDGCPSVANGTVTAGIGSVAPLVDALRPWLS